VQLLDDLPKDMETLKVFEGYINKLNALREKIFVYAQYDYKRDKYLAKSVYNQFIKERRIFKHENVQYLRGYKGTVYSFKVTVEGARGKIRGEIFLKNADVIKNPSLLPNKGVIITPGFPAYRQLLNNLATFLAEDNYLVLLHDISSQGESRGSYGNAERSENILRLSVYLKKTFNLDRICVMGHSMGGAAALFSILKYDIATEERIKIIQKEIDELILEYSRDYDLSGEF